MVLVAAHRRGRAKACTGTGSNDGGSEGEAPPPPFRTFNGNRALLNRLSASVLLVTRCHCGGLLDEQVASGDVASHAFQLRVGRKRKSVGPEPPVSDSSPLPLRAIQTEGAMMMLGPAAMAAPQDDPKGLVFQLDALWTDADLDKRSARASRDAASASKRAASVKNRRRSSSLDSIALASRRVAASRRRRCTVSRDAPIPKGIQAPQLNGGVARSATKYC